MDTTIQLELPPRVYEQVRSLVADGWFRDEKDLVSEALRRYLETHRADLQELFIREDVEWGLYGHD
jgi:Arc/MetJ-type ribon-helix-helix transcriptional regulator